MARQAFTIVSYAGPAVAGGASNITAQFTGGDNSPYAPGGMDVVSAEIAGLGTRDVRGQPKAAVWEYQIQLAAQDETNVQSMLQVFNERNGLQYIRATDGSGVLWRTSARIISPPAAVLGTSGLFRGAFWVPNPIWEEDTLQAANPQLNKSGTSFSWTETNNGNRKCYPKFTISPDSVKTDPLEDYVYSFRGFCVERSPFVYNNLPLYMFDQAGAAARVSLATLFDVAFAPVATVAAGGWTNSATTLVLAAGSALTVPTKGMITVVTGGVIEEIYYTSVTNNASTAPQLNGCVRGIGGTVAAAHNAGDSVKKAEIRANGDDCRYWINDVVYNRWLVSNGAAWFGQSTLADGVTNVTLPGMVKLTLAAALTASSTSIDFVEGVAQLEDTGYLVCETEVMYYSAKTALGVSGLVRGFWSTTAAAHTVAQPVYANPLLYTVGIGKGKAGAPPSPTNKRPAIDLPASNNLGWRWGDQASDASTIYYDPTQPDRTAQWTPGFDSDGNTVSPLMQLSASGNILTFKDDVPGDGSPPYNYVEQYFPQGIKKSDATAIQNTWTSPAEVLNPELWTRDINGTPKLQDQLQTGAAAANRNLPAVLAAEAFAVKLKGRMNAVTGLYATDVTLYTIIDNAIGATPQNGNVCVKFVLNQATLIESILVKLALNAAGSQDIGGGLYTDDGNKPATATSASLVDFKTNTVTSTTPAVFQLLRTGQIYLAAGTYWIVLARITGASQTVRWLGVGTAAMALQLDRQGGTYTAGAWVIGAAQEKAHQICSAYDAEYNAPIQPEMPMRINNDATLAGFRTTIVASFDKTILIFSTNAAVALPPLVHRVAGFTNGLYHCTGQIRNNTTGEFIDIDKWMTTGSTLEIDCENHTVVYTEGGVSLPCPRAIEPSDPVQWIGLLNALDAPAGNAMAYTERTMVSTDLTTTFRGQKV